MKKLVSDYKINVIDIRQFENTDVFQKDVKQVFDFIRCSEDMDEDAFDVVTKYTNSKELVQIKNYSGEGGKKDVCKAIRDLMNDSMEKGIEAGREEGREEGIKALVKTLREFNVIEKEIVAKIMKEFSLTEDVAKKYVE